MQFDLIANSRNKIISYVALTRYLMTSRVDQLIGSLAVV